MNHIKNIDMVDTFMIDAKTSENKIELLFHEFVKDINTNKLIGKITIFTFERIKESNLENVDVLKNRTIVDFKLTSFKDEGKNLIKCFFVLEGGKEDDYLTELKIISRKLKIKEEFDPERKWR